MEEKFLLLLGLHVGHAGLHQFADTAKRNLEIFVFTFSAFYVCHLLNDVE